MARKQNSSSLDDLLQAALAKRVKVRVLGGELFSSDPPRRLSPSEDKGIVTHSQTIVLDRPAPMSMPLAFVVRHPLASLLGGIAAGAVLDLLFRGIILGRLSRAPRKGLFFATGLAASKLRKQLTKNVAPFAERWFPHPVAQRSWKTALWSRAQELALPIGLSLVERAVSRTMSAETKGPRPQEFGTHQ